MSTGDSDDRHATATEHIRMRILLPTVLAFSLALALAALAGYAYFWQQEQEQNSASALRVQQSIDTQIRIDTTRFAGLIALIENSPRIRQAWQRGDRVALLQASLPLFQTLQTSFGISHFYFHDSTGSNFLRVHHPGRHGDPIQRETLRQARENGRLGAGLELGLFGQFVLRVVKPWMIDGQLVGYLEVGREIDHFSTRIKEVTGNDLITFIDKRRLLRQDWETTRNALLSPWERFPDWVVAGTTLAEIPPAISARLLLEGRTLHDTQITFGHNGRSMFATTYPLRDIADQEVGFMLMLRDVTEARGHVLGTIAVILGGGLLIGVLLFSGFYRYLGRIERRLARAYRDLSDWVDRHRQSELALRVSHEKLLASNRELESYSYSIAHDLRAPLRSITSFSQIVLSDADERLDAEDKEHLQRVARAGRQMAEMIDDILELARISRDELSLAEVDLSAMAEDILQRLQQAEPQRRVEWRVQPGMQVRADPRLLERALDNLLGNAWKYTAKTDTARIEITSREEGGETVYAVSDNGAGFDMAHAGKLFHSFQRLHSPDDFPGSGVGLAIVQRIIQRHHGRIWVRAEPGQGAEFSFVLGSRPRKEP